MSDQTPLCPKCNSRMVQRINRATQEPFWGCSKFPNCRGTCNIKTTTPSQPHSYTQPQPASQFSLNNKPFNPSPRQLAIHEFVKNGQGNLFVEAYAGTGKSTTCAFVINQIPRSQQVVYFAFNKAIADEFREKYSLNAMTMHSFGNQCLQQALGKLNVLSTKKSKLAQSYFPIHKSLRRFVTKIASLAINTNTDYTNVEALMAMIEHYNIELDESITEAKDDNGQVIPLEKILQTVNAIIVDSLAAVETDKVVDYDEMLQYPVIAGLIPAKFDFIFVDEAQDTNALQIEFVSKALKSTGRIVFVGDRYQAIYGFRGAMTDAVDNIISRFNTQRLPLDISYRCPQSIIKNLANPIVKEIKAAATNPEGEIKNITPDQAIKEWKQLDEALVMCRTNAPLVKQVLNLIKIGKKARVAGKNIAEGLIELIEKMDASSVDELLSKIESYRDKECQRYLDKDQEDQAELLMDKVECIIAVCDGETVVASVINRIESIFTNSRGGILFSSVHRAKGMESRDCYIIEPQQLPFKASKPWQVEQERNLAYVAFTRTLFRMTFVNGQPNMDKLARY